jgi:hypothetical protein
VARSRSNRRSNTCDHLFIKRGRKARTTEILLVTRTTTSDASERAMTSANLVVTLETLETSPSSPTLEGETTLETFRSKQRRWLLVGVAAPTHLHPDFVISNNSCCSACQLHHIALDLAINSNAGHGSQWLAVRRWRANLAGNTHDGIGARSDGQRRARGKLLLMLTNIVVPELLRAPHKLDRDP